MQSAEAHHLRLLSAVALFALACAGPHSLRDFPVQTHALPTRVIEPGSFGPEYGGGRIESMVSDGAGSLYLATANPYQVLRVGRDGTLLWARNGGEAEEPPFQGPRLTVSLAGDRILVADSGASRIHELDAAGNDVGGAAVSAAYRAARSREGSVFLYPNTQGFLLDTFDRRYHYLRSIVPLPGPAGQIAASGCLLLADPDGGVLALWNPTRTIYRLGPNGERRGEFTLDPPDLVTNVEHRMTDVKQRAEKLGGIGVIHPFVDFTGDREGRLAALYLFEEVEPAGPGVPTHRAAVYRFTRDGKPVDVITGLGSSFRVAFGLDDEIFGFDPDANLIHAYRIQPAIGKAG